MASQQVVIMVPEINTAVGPLRLGWRGTLERSEAERLFRIRAALPPDGIVPPGSLTPTECERIKRDWGLTLGASMRTVAVHEDEEEFEVAPNDPANKGQRQGRIDRMARGAVTR